MANSAAWMKLYTGVLLTDDTTVVLTPGAFGAWVRVLCYMHQKGEPEMAKTARLWGQIFGCGPNEDEACRIISELIEAGTGKIEKLDDGSIFMYSKRMAETLEEQRKKYRQGRKRKKKWREKKNGDGTHSERVPDAFGSTSTSTSTSDRKKEVSDFHKRFMTPYGKRVGIEKCKAFWLSASEEDRDKIAAHVPVYVESTPDIKYRKNPINYLEEKFWMDGIPKRPSTRRTCFMPGCSGRVVGKYMTRDYCNDHSTEAMEAT